MRQFLSPNGRRWTVCLFYFPSPPHARYRDGVGPHSTSVLRFESEGITLDLADWPHDWLDMPDEQLVALVRVARPPA